MHTRPVSFSQRRFAVNADKPTCKLLEDVKKYLDANGASLLNKVLAKVPLEVSSPYITDLRALLASSYADIAVGVDPLPAARAAAAAVTRALGGADAGIQCPTIPGAHQDSCI